MYKHFIDEKFAPPKYSGEESSIVATHAISRQKVISLSSSGGMQIGTLPLPPTLPTYGDDEARTAVKNVRWKEKKRRQILLDVVLAPPFSGCMPHGKFLKAVADRIPREADEVWTILPIKRSFLKLQESG